MRRLQPTTLVAALLVATGVAAQTDLTKIPIEELANVEVYAASRFVQKTSDAPASITIVTAEQIRTFGYRTLADLMANVRDFYVMDDRNYVYVGVRGFARPGDYNTRLLVLIDGHRINDPVYDQAGFDRQLPVDMDLIDRVEIVRGPTSSLYGTNAMMAVVNVITKRGAALNGVQTSGELGALGEYASRISFGRKLKNGTDLLLSVSATNIAGERNIYFPEYDASKTNYGIAQGLDGERSRKAYFSIARGPLLVRGAYGTRTRLVPTASYGSEFNVRESTVDTKGYLDAALDRRVGQWDVHGHAAVDNYVYDGVYPRSVTYLDYGRARWWTWDGMATRTILRHRVQFGSEFRYAARRAQFAVPNDIPNLPLPHPLVWGGFVQDEITLTQRLKTVVGVRYDDAGDAHNANPRFAVVFKPRSSTALKFLASSAFRAPNAYEIADNPAQVFLPTLLAEKMTAFEIIAEQYIGAETRLAISGFRNCIDGLITQRGTTINLGFVNATDTDTNGASIEAERRFRNGIYLRGAWTVQRTLNPATNYVLSNSPVQVAKAAAIVPLFRRHLDAGITMQATSGVENPRGVQVPPYVTTDITLTSAKLWRQVDMSASVYNVFNERIMVPAAEEHVQDALPQYGRTWRVKVSRVF